MQNPLQHIPLLNRVPLRSWPFIGLMTLTAYGLFMMLSLGNEHLRLLNLFFYNALILDGALTGVFLVTYFFVAGLLSVLAIIFDKNIIIKLISLVGAGLYFFVLSQFKFSIF